MNKKTFFNTLDDFLCGKYIFPFIVVVGMPFILAMAVISVLTTSDSKTRKAIRNFKNGN